MPDTPKNTLKPKRTRVQVKSEAGNFLFLYHTDTHTIEVHRRGLVYTISIADLVGFGETSEKPIYRVHPQYIEPVDGSGEAVRQVFE